MPPSRREDLVDAAMRVFHREGFNATGIEKVLREAGVSRMTLYNHFSSKDELIVAALRRRDEIYRNGMHKHVEAHASDPKGRILAAFDYNAEFCASEGFTGCMFLNASSEFTDPDCAIRRIACEHNRLIAAYLLEQCREANLKDAACVAHQLHILFEGMTARAHVLDEVEGGRSACADTGRLAREAAELIINAAAPVPA